MAAIKLLKKKSFQFKCHYQEAVKVGLCLHELILRQHLDDEKLFKETEWPHVYKLAMVEEQMKEYFKEDEVEELVEGICPVNLEPFHLSFAHTLVKYLCDHEKKSTPAPDLQNNLNTFYDTHGQMESADVTEFKGVSVWSRIEEYRDLFHTILPEIKDVYKTIETDYIDDHTKGINTRLDKILDLVVVEVPGSEVGKFYKKLEEHGKIPHKVKIEIKDKPGGDPNLMALVAKLGLGNNTMVWLLVNEEYIEDIDLQFYDCEMYLTARYDRKSAGLTMLQWHTETMRCDSEMINVLPSIMKQLYIRMRLDKVKINHLLDRMLELNELSTLGLYVDLREKDDCYGFGNVDLSTLPQLLYRGKQYLKLNLRFCACITKDNIPRMIEIIKKLAKTVHKNGKNGRNGTNGRNGANGRNGVNGGNGVGNGHKKDTQDHRQCTTLEFYQTQLNTGEDIETLLRELHKEKIQVTTCVKLQNEDNQIGSDLEKRLDEMARNELKLKKFMFVKPVPAN